MTLLYSAGQGSSTAHAQCRARTRRGARSLAAQVRGKAGRGAGGRAGGGGAVAAARARRVRAVGGRGQRAGAGAAAHRRQRAHDIKACDRGRALSDYGVSGRACLFTLATPARARTTGRKQREQHA